MRIFFKIRLFAILVILSCAVAACIDDKAAISQAQAYAEESAKNKIQPVKVPPQNPYMVRTTEGANALDLETPLRCNVNWETQQMILTLPFVKSAFKLERNGQNDVLPRFEVNGFSFDMMPAEQAIVKLTKEAGIRVSSADGPYTSISAEDLRGEFSEVIKMITDSAGIYYTYNAKDKILTLSRKVNMTLYTPQSRPIILGLLDVIRGSGITDIVTNWADYSITFDADVETKDKIAELIKFFESNPTLVAYDVSIFRLYPYDISRDIEWKEMLKAFDFGSITTAQTGVIGGCFNNHKRYFKRKITAILRQSGTNRNGIRR